MPKPIRALGAAILACALAGSAWAGSDAPAPETGAAAPAASHDSEQLEKELQSLTWDQFKSVVKAVPKLKADVDAYGPLGWQYVQANYKTYHWKKNINKLDDQQKEHLAELIQKSRTGGVN